MLEVLLKAKCSGLDEADPPQGPPHLVAVYRVYEEHLRKCNAVDFPDLIRLALQLLKRAGLGCPNSGPTSPEPQPNPDDHHISKSNPTHTPGPNHHHHNHHSAALDRPVAPRAVMAEHTSLSAIRTRYGSVWVLVDEFQDTNALQLELVLALAARTGRITAVGDANQAIYGWRGSSPRVFDTFRRRLPATTTIHLQTNYRSAPYILRAAATFLTPAAAVVRVLEGPEGCDVCVCVRGVRFPRMPCPTNTSVRTVFFGDLIN